MQVGDTSHRKSGQIGYPHAFRPSHRDWKCSNGGRLIHDKEDLAVFFQLSYQRSQLRFIIGQGAVQKTFAFAIQCNRMMRSFAYVDTDEDFNAFMSLNLTHCCS
jgi:hypothetical protein